MMKPILFNTEMVRAILYGPKTVTRRPLRPQPVIDDDGMWHWKDCQWMDNGIGFPESGIKDYAPYQPDDILYVRETWGTAFTRGGRGDPGKTGLYIYKADDRIAPNLTWNWPTSSRRWFSPVCMPKEAARIFLLVKDVKVAHIQDMTENDGVIDFGLCADAIKAVGLTPLCKSIWNGTIKKADLNKYGWDTNPWVFVIAFERVEKQEALKQ